MPKLTIDNKPIEVAPGTKVIEAAEQLGIMIPRFCYHQALGPVGACRVCAVMFLEGPVKGVQMSCMVDAKDGMVVSTTHPEAVGFRRQVLEWLMVNHPHDCPVCDEGGHCLLQDMTESSGHGQRRYTGHKRTYPDQVLGPLLQHEMNRCIQCYRCSRFYREFCGYRDLGVLGVAARVYYGRHADGILENPFAGNLADLCPTGVYTDKPSRYTGRRWDFERTPSLCISCSLGCHVVADARYRMVVRLEARASREVNGHFICDRGRHAYVYNDLPGRPRQALLKGRPVPVGEAAKAAAARLDDLVQRHGPESIGLWLSPRAGLETMAAAVLLSSGRGFRPPVFFDSAGVNEAVRAVVERHDPATAVSQQGLTEADVVLCAGVDPLAEGPMSVLALRQAVRRGAAVFCIDPRPLSLPFEFEHLAMQRADIETALAYLAGPQAAAEGGQDFPPGAGPTERLGDVAERLHSARRPVVMFGAEAIGARGVGLCHNLAAALAGPQAHPGLFPVLPGANAFGAGLLSGAGADADALLADIEAGRVRGLILVENDPFWHYHDEGRLQKALERLDLIVLLDYLESAVLSRAHIFLPATTIYESGGIFINQEGRAQKALPALRPGLPIAQTGGGSHPPRRYADKPPGADPVPAWRLLNAFSADPEEVDSVDPAALLKRLAESFPVLGILAAAPGAWPVDGLRLDAAGQAHSEPQAGPGAALRGAEAEPTGRLELLAVETLFGSEELSCRSPQLQELETPPGLVLSGAEARRLDVAFGQTVTVDTGRGIIAVQAAIDDRAADGSLILPRYRKLKWQQTAGPCQGIGPDSVRKG